MRVNIYKVKFWLQSKNHYLLPMTQSKTILKEKEKKKDGRSPFPTTIVEKSVSWGLTFQSHA